MLGLFEALDEINKSIFQHNKVERSRQNSSKTLPLKDTPKIDPENEVFDFFSTIFNLCSVERKRDCVRKNTLNPTPNPTFTDSTHIEKKCYKIYKNEKIMAILELNNSDFEVVDDPTNVVSDLYQIKPIGEYWEINKKNVIIKNRDIITTISKRSSICGASSIAYM